MILTDWEIRDLCRNEYKPLIEPFEDRQITATDGRSRISFGLSSVGYDIRLGNVIKLFGPTIQNTVIDPKNFQSSLLTEYTVPGDYFDIPAHGYVLGVSLERFNMPSTVAAICLTKSTYARSGLLCNTTPLEPGWTGYLTLELANLTPLPLRVYVNEGIAQILFYGHQRPEVTYLERKGKYMDQPPLPISPIVLDGDSDDKDSEKP